MWILSNNRDGRGGFWERQGGFWDILEVGSGTKVRWILGHGRGEFWDRDEVGSGKGQGGFWIRERWILGRGGWEVDSGKGQGGFWDRTDGLWAGPPTPCSQNPLMHSSPGAHNTTHGPCYLSPTSLRSNITCSERPPWRLQPRIRPPCYTFSSCPVLSLGNHSAW